MQLQPLQGLRENWRQFTLLVLVNALVGGMLGMERSVFASFAQQSFGMTAGTAMLSFIAAFGLSKAVANYYAGKLANRFGRKRLLLFGWIIAIPVPLILIYANDWNQVVFANLLLGFSQGFAWSSTVIMKIDIVGEKNRGFAMGLNEFAGYFSIGIMAWVTSIIAEDYGVIPYPFLIGLAIAVLGLLLTLIWVKDTTGFMQQEATEFPRENLKGVFMQTTFKNHTLSSVTQAGLVNNLNDGMIWGLLPLLLIANGYSQMYIGQIVAIYPAVWGIAQLFTGRMADVCPPKWLLFVGMLLQGLAIFVMAAFVTFPVLILTSVLLGLGTALVYPTFLTVISFATTPTQRSESVGVFRMWRDLGYAIGAVMSGAIAQHFGVVAAIEVVGLITLASAVIIAIRMPFVQKGNCKIL